MYIRMLIFLEVIMKEFKDYFSKSEIVLWSSSVMVIIISFCVFDRINYMTLCASGRVKIFSHFSLQALA